MLVGKSADNSPQHWPCLQNGLFLVQNNKERIFHCIELVMIGKIKHCFIENEIGKSLQYERRDCVNVFDEGVDTKLAYIYLKRKHCLFSKRHWNLDLLWVYHVSLYFFFSDSFWRNYPNDRIGHLKNQWILVEIYYEFSLDVEINSMFGVRHALRMV